MLKKLLTLLFAAFMALAIYIPTALADPQDDAANTSPQATSTPGAGDAQGEDQPTATPQPENLLEGLLLKNGDTGDDVMLLQMRLRDLGYYTYKITGSFAGYTAGALQDFQKENGLTADGVAGQQTLETLYSNTAKRKPVKEVIKPTPTPKPATPSTGGSAKYGVMKDWSWVRARWVRGEKCKVVDFNTGKVYYMIFVGGSKHADVEPATKKDCATLKATYGGVWSYARRAVIVYIDGVAVAGSTNGQPHGYETIANNDMVGQVCIHFLNSRTHGTNIVCPQHQAMVRRAAGKG